jgi:DNA-binding transcriptional regulator YiaG
VETHSDLSDLVKDIRRHLRLSQEGLADKIGVSFASINRWENGKTIPSKLARKQLNSLREQINNEKLKRVVLK